MRYVALGDSISIDEYTGVPGGGAASQLARRLEAEFQDLALDGCTTEGALDMIAQIRDRPDVITLTAGGNDLLAALLASPSRTPDWSTITAGIAARLGSIIREVKRHSAEGARFVVNTIYDPTDGVDARLEEMGIPASARGAFETVNRDIRRLAETHGLILADLEVLFRDHGFWSADPWLTKFIEPNYVGATTIAQCWHQLLTRAP